MDKINSNTGKDIDTKQNKTEMGIRKESHLTFIAQNYQKQNIICSQLISSENIQLFAGNKKNKKIYQKANKNTKTSGVLSKKKI